MLDNNADGLHERKHAAVQQQYGDNVAVQSEYVQQERPPVHPALLPFEQAKQYASSVSDTAEQPILDDKFSPHDHHDDKHQHDDEEAALHHHTSKSIVDANFIKLIIMLVLYICFYFIEISVGIFADSLSLIADSFHMFSDAIGIVIALVALIYSKKSPSRYFSFGYKRAELLGALINAIFLLAASLFIILDAIQRYIEPKTIERPLLVMVVGIGGVILNIVGMVLFCGHAHHHHNHDDHGHNHHNHHHHHHHHHGEKRNENICAVLLHIVSDFLGSSSVAISSLIMHVCRLKFPSSERYLVYIDPTVSLFIAIILFIPTMPLIIRVCKVFMQAVPETVDLLALRLKLESIDGVNSVHDLHAWSITSDGKVIGSVHLVLQPDVTDLKQVNAITNYAKQIFIELGVEDCTVQYELSNEACDYGIYSKHVNHHVAHQRGNEGSDDDGKLQQQEEDKVPLMQKQ